jgi:hypothetical protein
MRALVMARVVYSVQLGDDALDVSSCMVAEQEQNSVSSAMKLQ